MTSDQEIVRLIAGLVVSGYATDAEVERAYALVDRGGIVDHGDIIAIAAMERGIVQSHLADEWLEASIKQAGA